MFNAVTLKPVVLEFCEDNIKIGFGKCPNPRWTIPFAIESESEPVVRAHFTSTLHMIFNEYLHSKARSCQVIIIEPFLWPRITRDALYNALLLDFQVPMVSFQPRANMAAIATGMSVGMLVYVGRHEGDVVCFGDSRPITSTITSISFEGSESTDNTKVSDISDIIFDSLKNAPVDLRKQLAKNIIVHGSCSEVIRLKDKVLENLVMRCSELSASIDFKLQDILFPVDLLAWIGGSIFSTLPNNLVRYVSRDAVANINIPNASGIEGLVNVFHAPDWLSTNKKDWVFVGSLDS